MLRLVIIFVILEKIVLIIMFGICLFNVRVFLLLNLN